jgi:Protein of unknown function (DUF3551)
MEILMRVLVLAILTIATVSVTSSARAQTYNPRYPVCMKVIEMFGGERYECLFYTLDQCYQSALGLGATCITNPFYGGARPDRRYR